MTVPVRNEQEERPEANNQEVGTETTSLLHTHALHHHSSSLYLGEDVPYYSKPRAGRNWEEPDEPIHDIFFLLFFDLFYVAGIFNLAASLKESLDLANFLCVGVLFITLFSTWKEKLAFDSRFEADDNLFSRAVDLSQIVILGTMIASIKPAHIMTNTQNDETMIFFSSSLTAYYLTLFLKNFDVYFHVLGGMENAKRQALQDILTRIPTFLLYLLATLLAAHDYFFTKVSEARMLLVEEKVTFENNLSSNAGPLWLIFFGYFTTSMGSLLYRFVYINSRGESHKTHYVPLNLDFTIHRIGEWTNLLLGESVLALLIVEKTPGLRYYVTFYSGIITVTMFQYLYFRSNPFEADDHAFRRSSAGGYTFYYSAQLYSAALILIGTSYKVILHEYLDEYEREEEGLEVMDSEEQDRKICHMFSWSLAASFFFLDCMVISHRGLSDNFARFVRLDGTLAFMPILITIVDYGMIIVTASLSQWISDLETLVVVGMAIVVLQTLLRTRGLRYFPVSKAAMENLNSI